MTTLQDIRNALKNISCPLKDQATNLVWGTGNPKAQIVFLGEAPGAKEDAAAMPFVGSAGKKLDSFLAHIGLTRKECYITNVIKYRPPNNRPPTPQEVKRYAPYLRQELCCVRPRIIVALGNSANKLALASFNPDQAKMQPPITKVHGTFSTVTFDGLTTQVFSLFHPAACIYNRKLIPLLTADLDLLKSRLKDFVSH
jgi:DNA polymerase